ncbi:hypothetical protein [Tabrizicola soli]|uniref:FUSC family protein n=2 Tax=Tabrizicola soli TaxID=2185115 RepID=A0ABV7DYR8_9RHOB|nr:hypothetical protein [Tabrizicola soli]
MGDRQAGQDCGRMACQSLRRDGDGSLDRQGCGQEPRPARGNAPRHRDQFKACLALSSQPSLRNSALAGVQAGLAAAIALPLIWLSPWSHLIGFAALGALVALFGRFAPSESRSRIILSSAILQVLAVFTMSAAAWMGASSAAQLALLRSFAVCSCASP